MDSRQRQEIDRRKRAGLHVSGSVFPFRRIALANGVIWNPQDGLWYAPDKKKRDQVQGELDGKTLNGRRSK